MKVLVLDPIHDAGLALLRGRSDVELVHLTEPTDAAISSELADAEALLLRARKIPSEDFLRAERLKLISRHGVGCDNLDLPMLRERGIGVAVAADANLVSVAEHAFMLMLAAAKNLLAADRATRADDFEQRSTLGAQDIAGGTVLTVGYGRIGRAFAQRVLAFDASVLVYDPQLPEGVEIASGCRRVDELREGVAAADVVSIHVPLTADTANLFDAKILAAMKPGAILVNTARGGLVDEAALVEALDRGAPGRYATDVFAVEPPPADDPLFAREDVILSPHSAALTGGGMERMATGAAANILDYIDGRLPPRMVMLPPP